MHATIATPSGRTLRSRSRCRYVLVHEGPDGAAVVARSDNLRTLRRKLDALGLGPSGPVAYIIDTHRGVGTFLGDEAAVAHRALPGHDHLVAADRFKITYPVTRRP